MADLFTLRCQSFPEDTRVVGFRGSEGLSRLYAFELFLQITGSEARSFEIGDAVGAKSALVASRGDGRDPFVFAGVLSELSLLHETEERCLVRALLVPRLWHLSQTLHSRIFTQRSLPDILKAVLEEGGMSGGDYELRLTGPYRPEEHVCQYAESDLSFLSRWMEREGVYYFFEHSEEGEKLVLTDDKSSHKDLADGAIRYFPDGGKDVTAGERLESFVCRHRTLPAGVHFHDYDYGKPTLDVTGSAPVSRNGLGEIHLHGARVFTPDGAKRRAKIRAEQMKARERVFTGAGTALYLRSGATFEITDHPRAAFDAKYLAIEVEHQGNQLAGSADLRRLTGLDGEDVYRVHVTAIPADTVYRAEERTPWPRVYGTEHGVIDGEADSEYAQIDDHGRYLVRFAFDESDLGDGKASTWVRMMQPHGGGIEGWHFPLRKGTEVLFTFLGGDPDRPVIAGVVPNALKPSPVTRANHTKNVIQTGGRNRIEMEDKEGYERITLSTPHQDSYIRFGAPNDDHTMIIHTDGPTYLDAGHDLDVIVGGEKHETVTRAVLEQYNAKKTENVPNGPVTETYLAQTTTVNNLRSETLGQQKVLVNGGRQDTVLGPLEQLFASVTQRTYGGMIDEKFYGPASRAYFGSVFETYQSDFSATIQGSYDVTVTGPVKHTNSDAHIMVTLGATSDTFIGIKNENCIVGKIESMLGLRLALMVGVQIDLNAAAAIKVGGAPEIKVRSAFLETASAKLSGYASAAVTHAGLTLIA
ncbi:MAG: type VI secretion system tip protein TssI/VgrG [Polyangiaceae bacterium]